MILIHRKLREEQCGQNVIGHLIALVKVLDMQNLTSCAANKEQYIANNENL